MGARRFCEELIREGRVTVDGKKAELGMKVDPGVNRICVDGREVILPRENTSVLLYKPKGYVSTVRDPQGRPKVTDLVQLPGVRLFPVGRLDYMTSGLIILTNDGELAELMTHPRYGIWKTYHALVAGKPTSAALQQMRRGVPLPEGRSAPAKVRLLAVLSGGRSLLEISIREGKKRQVRKMCSYVGHPVIELKRTRIAFLGLQGLRPGEYRFLSRIEVERLKKLAKRKQES
ncbi:MAG: Pseudouridine synthase [Thermacetogenium phaeum]|uniref:Pseudouridine synthase n=1 Tax=Thermacetogenium phaeum TaxID=85874 RepID=A0A101FGL0_9THEO|nr:MAG: Pseudouridine synthase [Thermacetogenium phaeum]